MKTTFKLLAVIAILGLTLLGCKSASQQQSLEDSIEIVAQTAVGELLIEKPAWKPKFQEAATDLKILEATPNVTMANVIAIVQRLPVQELKSPRGRLYVSGGLLLLQKTGAALKLDEDNSDKVQGVARALRTGIENAISLSQL